jgi:chaperonin cofactor prefoldin
MKSFGNVEERIDNMSKRMEALENRVDYLREEIWKLTSPYKNDEQPNEKAADVEDLRSVAKGE